MKAYEKPNVGRIFVLAQVELDAVNRSSVEVVSAIALLDPLLDALSDELVQLWWIQIHIVPHKASNNRRDPLPIRRKLNES